MIRYGLCHRAVCFPGTRSLSVSPEMVFTHLSAENNLGQSALEHSAWIQGESCWKQRNYSDKSSREMWKKLFTLFWQNISLYQSAPAEFISFCPFHLPPSLELLSQSSLLVTPLEVISLNRGLVVLLPSHSLPGRIVFLYTIQWAAPGSENIDDVEVIWNMASFLRQVMQLHSWALAELPCHEIHWEFFFSSGFFNFSLKPKFKAELMDQLSPV